MGSSLQDENRKSSLPSTSYWLYGHIEINLKWDRVLRSDTGNLAKDIEEIDIDDELIEDDEERVELHNWLTDSETQT